MASLRVCSGCNANAREDKRKKWTNEQMMAAIKAVEENDSGINQSAIAHGVPKTTLKDRLSGHVQHGTKVRV